jgi:CRP-like cAMP-binding protein
MIFSSLFRFDSEPVQVRKGDALFKEGESGELMYVLVTGTADIRIGDRVVERARTGAVIGELAIVEPGPRSATVTATSDCSFAAIDEERFRYLVTQTPHFAVEVMQTMARRLRQADALIA